MTVRDRIWTILDDPDFGRHPRLRNALYQLLVAIEIPRALGHVSVERCLDLAMEAARDGSPMAVTRAGAVIDAMVAALAGHGPSGLARGGPAASEFALAVHAAPEFALADHGAPELGLAGLGAMDLAPDSVAC
jgi:hypothetical protein